MIVLDVTRTRLLWDLSVEVTIEAAAADPDTLVRMEFCVGDDDNSDGTISGEEWTLLAKSNAKIVGDLSVAVIDSLKVRHHDVYAVRRFGADGSTWTNSIGKGEREWPDE